MGLDTPVFIKIEYQFSVVTRELGSNEEFGRLKLTN